MLRDVDRGRRARLFRRINEDVVIGVTHKAVELPSKFLVALDRARRVGWIQRGRIVGREVTGQIDWVPGLEVGSVEEDIVGDRHGGKLIAEAEGSVVACSELLEVNLINAGRNVGAYRDSWKDREAKVITGYGRKCWMDAR